MYPPFHGVFCHQTWRRWLAIFCEVSDRTFPVKKQTDCRDLSDEQMQELQSLSAVSVSVQAGWGPLSSWYINQMWPPPGNFLWKHRDVWCSTQRRSRIVRSELLIALNASNRFPASFFCCVAAAFVSDATVACISLHDECVDRVKFDPMKMKEKNVVALINKWDSSQRVWSRNCTKEQFRFLS